MARPRRQLRPRHRLAALAGLSLAGLVVVGGCSKEPERSTDAFCAHVVPVQDLDTTLASGDTDLLARQLADLQRLQQVTPTELEPQVAILVGITQELSTTVGTTPDPDAAAAEVFGRHRADLPAIEAAGRAVTDYAAQRCGITIGGTAPGTAPSGSATVPASATSAPTTAAPTTTASGKATSTTKPGAASTTARPTTTAAGR